MASQSQLDWGQGPPSAVEADDVEADDDQAVEEQPRHPALLPRQITPGSCTTPRCLTWTPPPEARDVACPVASCAAHPGRCCRTPRGGVAGDHASRKASAARLAWRCQRCGSDVSHGGAR